MKTFFQGKIRGLRFRLKRLQFIRTRKVAAVLIYTMGKVGSSTIYAQLIRKYPWLPVFQIHFLSDHWVKNILPKMDARHHFQIELANRVKQVINNNPDCKIKLITLVRDPITRDISDIFQNWRDKYNVNTINDVPFEQVISDFNTNNHDYTLNWFDTEFKAFTGIDVYQLYFPKEQSYQKYTFAKFDLLIIKLDTIGKQLTPVVNEFLGLESEEIPGANRSENKEGKELYAQIKQHYKAPKVKLDRVYQTSLLTHFYTTEEIAAMRSKWE